MAVDVAVRFVLGSGNVDFSSEEILYEPISHNQRIDIQERQVGVPYVNVLGDIWKTLTITFIHHMRVTKTKIDQLIDEDDEMICYYAYLKYTTTKSLNVIFYPQQITHSYKYAIGDLLVREITLTFLESSK